MLKYRLWQVDAQTVEEAMNDKSAFQFSPQQPLALCKLSGEAATNQRAACGSIATAAMLSSQSCVSCA